ncbi:MAG TPA: hypothetical protein VF911_14470 [Thermoanaerobaculia bacterium]|jgi:hypothetical protein
MKILFALLLLATSFPSTSRTSWMRPEAFHLTVGMPRAEAIRALDKWTPKQGKSANELIVDYSEDKSMTLELRNGRVISIRFELFTYLNGVRGAFNEERDYLRQAHGDPRVATKSILVYDNTLPNVMVVVTDDPKTEQGKKGLGVLAVRYYDPRT